MKFWTKRRGLAQGVGQVAIVITMFSLWSRSQPEPAPNPGWMSQLLGSWESEDKPDGQPRITIELRLEEGKPAGAVVIWGVRSDYDPNSLTLPIREASLQTEAISFETDPGEDGITHWTLSMVSDDKALLSAVRDGFEIPRYVMQRPADR